MDHRDAARSLLVPVAGMLVQQRIADEEGLMPQ
jgi:hypothetical protein